MTNAKPRPVGRGCNVGHGRGSDDFVSMAEELQSSSHLNQVQGCGGEKVSAQDGG